MRTRQNPSNSFRSFPGGIAMNPIDGAASSCASFRAATAAMFANRLHLPVVNNLCVSASENDWIATWRFYTVQR